MGQFCNTTPTVLGAGSSANDHLVSMRHVLTLLVCSSYYSCVVDTTCSTRTGAAVGGRKSLRGLNSTPTQITRKDQ